MSRILLTLAAVAVPVSAYCVPLAWGTLNSSDPVSEVEAVQASHDILACGDRTAMANELKMQFREVPTAVGVVDEHTIMELFVSPNGSWTIMATDTDEQSCVMAVGEGFESNAPIHEAASGKPTVLMGRSS